MNPTENSADSQQTAINRRRLTLEHLSARHQQLKQQQQQKLAKDDEITKIDDEQNLIATTNEPENKNDDLPDSSSFLVHFKGQILGSNFPGIDHIYCRYGYVYGSDWQTVSTDTESGYSQIATRNKLASRKLYLNDFNQSDMKGLNDDLDFIWNLPIELTMNSTNVHGWPQLIVSVYGLNFFGLDVIRGYGHIHLPPIPGRHELKINLFRPKSSTLLGEISCYLGGKRPEFLDFKCVAEGDGRDILHFESEKGEVILQLDVIVKDMLKHGYVYN